ncbi:MAG: hypothetical protein QXJ06_06040 [Candidatus Aenigmatarchaeota archaeon]
MGSTTDPLSKVIRGVIDNLKDEISYLERSIPSGRFVEQCVNFTKGFLENCFGPTLIEIWASIINLPCQGGKERR